MLGKFISDERGVFALMVAVLLIPLLLAVGFAVDLARYLRAENYLQELADGTSLALAASREEDKDKLATMADDFIGANASAEYIDMIKVSSLKTENDTINLTVDGRIRTYFMGLVNIDTMDVGVRSEAVRGVSGSVEVALVLDNTDSMNVDKKIDTLKVAATNLVAKLHENPDANVRIGLVPYAEQINVGTANRNATWLSVPEDYSKTTPGGACYTVSSKNGKCLKKTPVTDCMVEKDGVMVPSKCGGGCTEYEVVPVTPYEVCPKDTVSNYKWFGCVGSRISAGKPVLNDLTPTIKYPGFVTTGQKCLTEILPLTDSKSAVDTAISGMITSRSGYTPQTYIPGGLMWGINVLSPDAPYVEGLAYDTANMKPRKVIVLMTDGLNTRRTTSAGDYTSANAAQRTQVNTDTTTLCTYAKGKNIEIFTVAFKVDDEAAKTMLQGCATDAGHYYDAADPEALLAAFSGIAQSLTHVRLTK
jgi:Flp pilus assembly protein TadG